MKTHLKTIAFFVLVFAALRCPLTAETILLENEDVIQGTIINYTNETVTITTPTGKREIPIRDIHLIDYLGSAKDYQRSITQSNAFIIYLKNGEVIEGAISQFSNDFITLESLSGHGSIEIPTDSVNYITATQSRLQINRRHGIGYVQKKSTLNSPSGTGSYAGDQLSYKMFFSDELFGNLLLAYGNASYNDQKLQMFSIDYRMGLIFKTIQQMAIYYGGAVGYLQIRDDTVGIDGTGTAFSAFIGAELSFNGLPNFGFSGELGYRVQKAGDYSVSELSIGTFPSFSIHYYF
jgi:ribosome maturation factor RimP